MNLETGLFTSELGFTTLVGNIMPVEHMEWAKHIQKKLNQLLLSHLETCVLGVVSFLSSGKDYLDL